MTLPEALAGLAEKPVWVAWAYEAREGADGAERKSKVPKSPKGGNAKTSDPSTWGTYAEAAAAAEREGYDGVGAVLTDGLVGIDLDHAVDADGSVKPWAREIVDGIGSYTEVSPSGDGLHVLAYGDAAELGPVGRADHGQGLEVYNHGRYFTVTGDQVGDAPLAERTAEVARLVASRFAGESAEDRVRSSVVSEAQDCVRRRANETVRHNARRDKVKYARVPMGDACGFCLMLSSRGFVYASEETAGIDPDHYHRSCRCRVVPGFYGLKVDGYDHDTLYKGYRDCYETLGLRDGIRKEWDALPWPEHEKWLERHEYDENRALDAFAASRTAREIELRDRDWIVDGVTLHFKEEDGATPLDKEKAAANWLSGHGFDVTFRRVRREQGVHTSDILIKGVVWEIKQPVGDGKQTIYHQFEEAAKQSNRLVLDISQIDGVGRWDEDSIQEKVSKYLRWTFKGEDDEPVHFEEVLIISDSYLRRIKKGS